MKIESRFLGVKRKFGQYLREVRLERELSEYDVGYVLGVSHACVCEWEHGRAFPGSIVRLKKLHLLFDHVPEVIVDAFNRPGVVPTQRQWSEFQRIAFIGESHPEKDHLSCSYAAVDKRDDKYRVAFGEYLRGERLARSISGDSLSKALGVCHARYWRWESGSSFPSNLRVLMLLDKLYGDTISVIFGLCKTKGIHLDRAEKKEVLLRLSEFDNTTLKEMGKSKPPAWEAYMKRRAS